ncbi:MAG: hypothetical protein ACR2HE_02780 [Casimicrobiaceae bacterium]
MDDALSVSILLLIDTASKAPLRRGFFSSSLAVTGDFSAIRVEQATAIPAKFSAKFLFAPSSIALGAEFS